jgi:hypothetical protein
VGKKLGLAVNEVLFVLNAARNLNRRPDIAFVSYARWPTSVVARAPAWNVVPDLVIEIVSPTNLAEEIDRKITDYFQAQVRLVWVFYPDSGRVYVYQSPMHVSILERTETLDGGDILPGFRVPISGCTKPWPNQNKTSPGPRSPRPGLLACGARGGEFGTISSPQTCVESARFWSHSLACVLYEMLIFQDFAPVLILTLLF